MTIFKHHTSFLLASLACVGWFAPAVAAENIELKSGDVLSGKISAFDAESLTLVSPVSDQPLEIESHAVRCILFDDQHKANSTHGERLTLINGDSLPCRIISLDEKQLKISTWYAGEFTIPRTLISGVQFGIHDQRVIYSGGDALSEWSTREGKWSAPDENAYTCLGSGVLARRLDLSTNLRVSYTLEWKGAPNFVFRFCGEKSSATTKQDTYEFSYNNAGMQIRRYEGNKNAGAPLANIPLKPDNFTRHSIKLDFHINRKEGAVTFFVDGKKIDTYPDQFNASTGSYIIFNNRSSKNQITVKNIVVADIGEGSMPRHREKVRETKSDVLLDSTGDKSSGEILGITTAGENKRKIRMKLEFNPNPLNVPEHRVSSLSFSHREESPKLPASDFTAMIQSNGQLQISEPKFLAGFVEAIHPVLGKCRINVKVLNQLKKNLSEKKDQ